MAGLLVLGDESPAYLSIPASSLLQAASLFLLFLITVPGLVEGVEGDGGAVGLAVFVAVENDQAAGVEEFVEQVDRVICRGYEAVWDRCIAGFVVTRGYGKWDGSVLVENGWRCGVFW